MHVEEEVFFKYSAHWSQHGSTETYNVKVCFHIQLKPRKGRSANSADNPPNHLSFLAPSTAGDIDMHAGVGPKRLPTSSSRRTGQAQAINARLYSISGRDLQIVIIAGHQNTTYLIIAALTLTQGVARG
jgi:hypothetical protein